MLKPVTLSLVTLVAFTSIARLQATAATTCIGKHCGIFAPASSPTVTPLAEKGIGTVLHPAIGVYCISPNVLRGPVFVPVVSLLRSVDPVGITPGVTPVKLVEINFGGLVQTGCPIVDPPGAPFVEVDTFQVSPGAAAILASPSDNVGFLIQF